MKRVTVSLPDAVVEEIDRWERNRSRFLLVAAEREIELRRREALELSLENPHGDSLRVAEEGLAAWGDGMNDGDEDLVESRHGAGIRWSPEHGWVKESC
jgi:hypothetical protein